MPFSYGLTYYSLHLQIIDGNADVDELIVQYPFQTFFTAFLKHIKRVFAYLRRSPDGSRNGSVIPSSPNRYYQHIAKKRVKLDEVRRNSAPPPIRGVSAQFESPYQNLRESLRNARKSSPIRRAPSLFNPRPFSAIGTSRVQENHRYSIREDSDEEVENELITRSSAALDSEPEGDELDQTITQAIVEEEENVDITMEADVELENIETQMPQRNLLDRSALGAFLEETQTETQTQVEARDSVQRDFWGEELADGIETQAVHEDYQMGSYADLDSYEPPQDEENVEDSQASTLPPGRSDAPSPSLANPQSYDDAASDPFLDSQTMQDGRVLETEEEAEVEIDELRSDTPGANRMAAEARAVFGAALEDDEEEVAGEGSVTNETQEAADVAEDSREGSKELEDSAPTLPETQPIPQAAPPRTRGRKGNK